MYYSHSDDLGLFEFDLTTFSSIPYLGQLSADMTGDIQTYREVALNSALSLRGARIVPGRETRDILFLSCNIYSI